jgi:glucose-1-phosphate thymidylyltransferase
MPRKTKGIILAGGTGSRLYPLTVVSNKQLQPVHDKPMVYYPLSTLLLGGIKDIAVISSPDYIDKYKTLLKDGSQWGVSIEYFIQNEPKGISDAFLICEEFIDQDNVCLILGDNIFYGYIGLDEIIQKFSGGAHIFTYFVSNPQDFGVLDIKRNKVIDFKEKPKKPTSNHMIPGLYLYDNTVVEKTKNLKPSKRGELEITDLNRVYLKEKNIEIQDLGRATVWFDAGKCSDLQKASEFIRTIEEQQIYKIGCLEEIALKRGFISYKKLELLVKQMPDSEYKDYLKEVLKYKDEWFSKNKKFKI